MPKPPALGSLLRLFMRRVERRTARVGVIGLGYTGLPLATEFAKAGYRVTGFEIDEKRVGELNRGRSYIQDVPTREVRDLVRKGTLRATASFDELRRMDAIDICVPTPLRKTKDPDVSHILAAVGEIAPRLRRGQLIVLESTTYPGTTEELLRPLLEERGFSCGKDFFLAFSPERVDPGNPTYHTRNIAKVVGGVTGDCTRAAVALYATVMDKVVPVSSSQIAEMVKLLENTFRSVNIGLVNEIALLSDKLGLDVWEVIDAAATKPFGFMPFYPGPGLGGHCIPIDPFYLSWKAKQSGFEARFIELAGQVNGQMPYHVAGRVREALNARRLAITHPCSRRRVQARYQRRARISGTGPDRDPGQGGRARRLLRPVRAVAHVWRSTAAVEALQRGNAALSGLRRDHHTAPGIRFPSRRTPRAVHR